MSKKSLSKNSIFYLIYTVLNVLFPFLTGVYVARVLLPDAIGEVAYAQNIAQYFVVFAFLGLPTYGLREIAKARDDKQELNKLYSELLSINFISTTIFLSIYLILIFSIPRFSANLSLYFIVGISIALNFFNNSWLYEGLEEFKFISIRNIIFKLISFACLVIFVRAQDDYLIYAAISVIGTAGNYLLNIIQSRKYVKFQFKGLRLGRHMKPILYLVAVNLAIEIYTMVDTTMLGIFSSNENVAFYTYGSKMYKILLQIVNTFTVVVVPRLSALYKEGRLDEYNAILTKTLKVILLLAIPMIVGMQFVANYLVCAIYGDAYINSAYVLRILCFILVISPIGYLLGSRVLLIAGKEKMMLIAVGSGAILNVIGNALMIPYYGEYGAAIASVVSEIAVMIIYVCMGKKYFRLGRWWDTALKVGGTALMMAGYLVGCMFIPLPDWAVCVLQIVGAVLLYILGMIITKETMMTSVIRKIIGRFKKHERTNIE